MDDLIARVAAAAGIEADTARQAIAAIFNFLQKEGPQDQVAAVMAKLPGAQALASSADGSGFGGLMGLATQLMGLGMGMSELQAAGREIFGFMREKLGEDTVRDIAGAIPGLSQFI
jgi:hypothetical protein